MELTYDKDEVGTVSYKTSGVVYVFLAPFTWLYLYLLNTQISLFNRTKARSLHLNKYMVSRLILMRGYIMSLVIILRSSTEACVCMYLAVDFASEFVSSLTLNCNQRYRQIFIVQYIFLDNYTVLCIFYKAHIPSTLVNHDIYNYSNDNNIACMYLVWIFLICVNHAYVMRDVFMNENEK